MITEAIILETMPNPAAASKTFSRIDHTVWSMLWRWAARRHSNKSAPWVKKRHFKTQGPRNWFFAATEKKEDGADDQITLRKESDTPIQRHLKILANANPHDRN